VRFGNGAEARNERRQTGTLFARPLNPEGPAMTRQTAAPLDDTHLAISSRLARELIGWVRDGTIDLDPPYQRGLVWSDDQRIALISSWMQGLPTGVVILSDRAQPAWTAATGDIYATGSTAVWAVVDGKQRLSAALAWYGDAFAVPASWFPADLVDHTEDTDDGPYVRHSGLTITGQRKLGHRAQFAVAEFRTAATVHDEAEVYLLVNGGGTPQTETDMQRARDHTLP
jgi:Protein of unknown function DUF262